MDAIEENDHIPHGSSEVMKCENCLAFGPNLEDVAYMDCCKYKCKLYGIMVMPSDEACRRFDPDPKQCKRRNE